MLGLLEALEIYKKTQISTEIHRKQGEVHIEFDP